MSPFMEEFRHKCRIQSCWPPTERWALQNPKWITAGAARNPRRTQFELPNIQVLECFRLLADCTEKEWAEDPFGVYRCNLKHVGSNFTLDYMVQITFCQYERVLRLLNVHFTSEVVIIHDTKQKTRHKRMKLVRSEVALTGDVGFSSSSSLRSTTLPLSQPRRLREGDWRWQLKPMTAQSIPRVSAATAN